MFESGPMTTAEVAAFLERLPSLDVSVPDGERIDQIGLLESVKGACSAAQARTSVAFEESQLATRAADGVPARAGSRGVGAQIALARRESPHSGSRHLGLAKALVHEMTHTLEHLTAGRVSEWRATVMARETACLSAEQRGTVDRLLAAELPALGDREVQSRARALAAQLDNAAMAQRAARAERERRVSIRPAPDTMTYVTALLPVAQGVAVHAALVGAAATAAASGDDRGRGQVMADTLVERVTGQSSAAAVPLEVHLVMPAETLLGGGDEAAVVDGNPLPSAFARDLVDRCAAADAKVWLRRLFTTPDGTDLVAMESDRRRFDGLLRRMVVLRDQVCRTPWCDSPVRHADHVVPARDGGETALANGRGTCEACNYVKEVPGWGSGVLARGPSPVQHASGREPPHAVRLTTPTGHGYDSTAPPVLPGRSRTSDPVADLSTLERHLMAVLDAA